ncbi:MAG: hypothetical protein WCV84_05845 [Patescibacteria group bacterium]
MRIKTLGILIAGALLMAGGAVYFIAQRAPSSKNISDQQTPYLAQTYVDAPSLWAMRLPTGWEYSTSKADPIAVTFRGPAGTPEERITVQVLTAATELGGGTWKDLTDAAEEQRTEIKAIGTNVRLTEPETVEYLTATQETLKALQWLAEFDFQGANVRRWQIAVMRPDNKTIHIITYAAPSTVYPQYETLAKQIIQTWWMKE